MIKPQDIAGYNHTGTSLAQRGLLDIWRHLGGFRKYLVLVGGLVPRYLIGKPQHKGQREHCGSMDVDLGVSLAVANQKAYTSIRERLIGQMGFVPGKNQAGNAQRHSFVKKAGKGELIVDFLTVSYGGPKQKIRAVEKNLSAIQTEGLGLALENPLEINVKGELMEGGLVEERIRVCRAVPYVVLKSLAFDDRGERKDAYDLVYTLRYYKQGPSDVAGEITKGEHNSEAFSHALAILKNRFKSLSSDGVEKYARFIGEDLPSNRNIAYAAVQEFLNAVKTQ